MANEILKIILSITGLFVLLLVIKKITKLKFCVLCTSVSLTWISFLILYWLGRFPYPLLIAVLMGESTIGIYYMLEKVLAERYQIFRLPFLLTSTVLVYLLLKVDTLANVLLTIVLLLLLWLLTIVIYIFRDDKKVNKIFKQIVACCRDW